MEITLSAQCELEMVEDPNIERAIYALYRGEEIEEEIEEEMEECSNMFTFHLANLEADDDELSEENDVFCTPKDNRILRNGNIIGRY